MRSQQRAVLWSTICRQQLVNELPTRISRASPIACTRNIDMDRSEQPTAVNDTQPRSIRSSSSAKRIRFQAGTLGKPRAGRVELETARYFASGPAGAITVRASSIARIMRTRRPLGVQADRLRTALDPSFRMRCGGERSTAASLFMDAPETFLVTAAVKLTRHPRIRQDVFKPRVSLREGTGCIPLNVVTVRIAEKVGYSKIARQAEKLGLRDTYLPSAEEEGQLQSSARLRTGAMISESRRQRVFRGVGLTGRNRRA